MTMLPAMAIVRAVAESQSVHAETIDVWLLLLQDHTLSGLQELITQARALLAQGGAE